MIAFCRRCDAERQVPFGSRDPSHFGCEVCGGLLVSPLAKGRKAMKRGRRKAKPSLTAFHEAVVARAGGRCEMADANCYGGLCGHHYVPKTRLRSSDAAYTDPRNGVALCVFHHAQVENRRLPCPRPVELAAFLDEHGWNLSREAA